MKYIHLYTSFLMLAFHTFCGQNQTEVKKNSITLETQGVITSHGPGSVVRKVVQNRKGNVWIASWEGIIRYDGKSLPTRQESLIHNLLHRT